MSAPHANEPPALLLPSHVDAERHVLSSLMGHGRLVASELAALLTAEDFFFANHKALFRAMMQVYAEGSEITVQTVAEALERRVGGLRDVGGVERLEQLSLAPPSVRGVVPAAKMLNRYRVRRDMIRTAQSIAAMAADLQEPHEAMLTKCVGLVQSVALSDSASTHTEKAHEVGARVMEAIRERKRLGLTLLGAPTGLSAWDKQVSGIVPRKLNLVAGASGMGKTASLLTMVHGAALAGAPCLVFSLEMENDALWYRALAMHSRIDSRRISVGNVDEREMLRVEEASAHWSALPVEMNDWAGMTTRDIEAATRDFVSRRTGVYQPIVFIDYAQIIASDDRRDTNEAQKIQRNIYALRELAKNLNLGMVVLAQLNRDVDKREDKRPRLSDIADSAGLVKAADTITLLYRSAYYAQLRATEEGSASDEVAIEAAKYKEADPDEAEWIVAKGRDGGTRSLRMTYHPTRTLFTSGGLETRF